MKKIFYQLLALFLLASSIQYLIFYQRPSATIQNEVLLIAMFLSICYLFFILLKKEQQNSNLKQQMEQALYSTQQAAMIGSWAWIIQEKYTHFSDTALTICGLESKKANYSDAEFLSLIYKPDRVHYLKLLQIALKTGNSFKAEIRCDLKRPYKRWLESRGEMSVDNNNRPYRMIGMLQDISQEVNMRQMQQAMKNILKNIIEHENLEQILSNICSAIHDIEPSIHCVIYLASRQQDKPELHHGHNIPQSLIHILNSITVGDEHSELIQTLAQSEIIYIDDLNKSPSWVSANQMLNNLNLSAFYGQPLFSDGETTQGALCLYLQDNLIPKAIVTQILETASRVAAVAIDGQLQSDNRQKIQQQLYHSQKMESIGHLTGGIAHDFNNILGSIVGYNSLAKKISTKHKDKKLSSYLNEVSIASDRARDLISQMMIFSRSEPSKNISIDAKPIIKEVLQFVKSMIPSSINISYFFGRNIKNITINPISLHQVIMNLLVNAKDAIENDIGNITIDLNQTNLDSRKCVSCHEHFNGQFVCITIIDSGSGISSEYIGRVFEPFFTTKDVGRGTGMGLSVVHGIVHEANGHIGITSEAGKGTEIKLYIPASELGEEQENRDIFVTESSASLGNGEKIMVVDDDIPLSLLYEEILKSYGYQVSRFENSQIALENFLNDPDQFHLILSDQTMPFMTGDVMAKKMLNIRPDLPIIICTGFSETINQKRAEDIGIKALLAKPVDMYKLLDLIDETIKSR